MKDLEEHFRQSVTNEIVTQLLASDDLKGEVEKRIARKKELFCQRHPDLDEYFADLRSGEIRRLSRHKREKNPVELEARQMVNDFLNSGRVCLDGFTGPERTRYVNNLYHEAMQSIFERPLK
jgi:hypothetical protein